VDIKSLGIYSVAGGSGNDLIVSMKFRASSGPNCEIGAKLGGTCPHECYEVCES
jgi:hypothetical protein